MDCGLSVPSADVELQPGKRKAAGHTVDDVDLTGVEARLEACRGHLELKERGVPVSRLETRSLHHRRLEHVHLAAVEGQARAQLRDSVFDGGVVDLVIHVQRLTGAHDVRRSEEHTSELQSHSDLVCRLLLEKKNTNTQAHSLQWWGQRRERHKPEHLMQQPASGKTP